MYWDKFVKRVKVRYFAPRDIEKLVDEFFDLKKG